MKKITTMFMVFCLFVLGNAVYAQAPVSLDQAVRTAAEEIEVRLDRGVRVVALNFNSPSERFSRYVLDELMTELVRSRNLSVVDRAHLELIQQEMAFQMSGDVSDASAQRIGQLLGAQSIISGSIDDLGSHYVVRFRTIEVESAAVQVLSRQDVRKDTQIAALMGEAATRAPAAGVPGGRAPVTSTFSTGRKVGAGFLNLFFGLGSFTMGDWVGGLIVGGIQAAGWILFTVGEEDELLELVGAVCVVGGWGFGFARPFTYDNALARRSAHASNPMNNIILAPVPTRGGGVGFTVMYNASF